MSNAQSALSRSQADRNILIIRLTNIATYGFFLAIPVMIDYVQKTTGHSASVYFYVTMASSAVSILAGLYIGALSDLHGRRGFLIGGLALSALSWIALLLVPCIPVFFLTFSAMSISYFMTNVSTCLYETVDSTGEIDSYPRHEQNMQAFPQYVLIPGLFISGMLYEINPLWPFLLNAVACTAVFLLSFSYTEAPRIKSAHTKPMAFLKDILGFLIQTRRMRWYALFSGIMLGVVSMNLFIFQAAFLDIAGSAGLFSVILIFVYLVRAIGSQQADRLLRIMDPTRALILILVAGGAFTCLAALSGSLPFFALFMILYMFSRGLIAPVICITSNEMLTSDRRATGRAAINIIERMSSVLCNFLAGAGISMLGAQGTLLGFGLWVPAAGLILLGLYLGADAKKKAEAGTTATTSTGISSGTRAIPG